MQTRSRTPSPCKLSTQSRKPPTPIPLTKVQQYINEPRSRPKHKVWVEIPCRHVSPPARQTHYNSSESERDWEDNEDGVTWNTRKRKGPGRPRGSTSKRQRFDDSEESDYSCYVSRGTNVGGVRRTKRQRVNLSTSVVTHDEKPRRRGVVKEDEVFYVPGPAVESLDVFDHPDFISFYMFCCTFAEEMQWVVRPIQWIHESLSNEENVFLIDIIIKLLALIPRGDEPRYSTWEHKLRQELAIRSSLEAWPEDVSFWQLDAIVKLTILNQLSQWAVDDQEACRAVDPKEMRVTALGTDSDGRAYWHFDVDSLDTRLYCEARTDFASQWHLVASEATGWERFLAGSKKCRWQIHRRLHSRMQGIWNRVAEKFEDDAEGGQSSAQKVLAERGIEKVGDDPRIYDHFAANINLHLGQEMMAVERAHREAEEAKKRQEQVAKRREARKAAKLAAAEEKKRIQMEEAAVPQERGTQTTKLASLPALSHGPMPAKGKDRVKQQQEWERARQIRKALSKAERNFSRDIRQLPQNHSTGPRWKRVPVVFDPNFTSVEHLIGRMDAWENVKFSKEIMDHEMDLTLTHACKHILDGLRRHQSHAVFLVPVDRLDFPEYYATVKWPMAIYTIYTNLMLSEYTRFFDFIKDTLLIFSNCKFFNDPDSDIVGECVDLEKEFFRILVGLDMIDEVG
ncbi:Bromodomain adjacent to zinc finger domain protein 2B, partial [Rhizophlyctis rosea]